MLIFSRDIVEQCTSCTDMIWVWILMMLQLDAGEIEE